MSQELDIALIGGRVIDPEQGINRITGVGIRDGKIAEIGENLEPRAKQVLDVKDKIVTPGLFDMHVHTYGFVSFSDPDSIGIYQGVTSVCDAGGAGPLTFAEFKACMEGRLITSVYAHVFINAGGVCDFDEGYGYIRTIADIPLNDWLDIVDHDRDLVRSIKIAAFGNLGTGILKMEKGLSEITGLPLYAHTGDILVAHPKENTTGYLYGMLDKGDMVTHFYNNNPGNIIGGNGRVIPEVHGAAKRGVLFDVGMGSFNFSFDVAEKALAEGCIPSIISSDLQQINVTGPVYSLTNVMSLFLLLGFSIEQIVERVTIAPAKALGLEDKIGSLKPGRQADVSVLTIEQGDFEFPDSGGTTKKGTQKIHPVMAFKAGKQYDSDERRALDERNWSLRVAEDHVPERAEALDHEDRKFLFELHQVFSKQQKWEGMALHRRFHNLREAVEVPLPKALEAVFKTFFDEPFTYQAGWLFASMEKPFVLKRLSEVSVGKATA
jgi:dihydroorotase